MHGCFIISIWFSTSWIMWVDILNVYTVGSRRQLAALWPSDAIWWHRSGSKLAQVMACCLTAPSHYLNQCWLIISQWHYLKAISQEIMESYLAKISLLNLKFHWYITGANKLTHWPFGRCGLNCQIIIFKPVSSMDILSINFESVLCCHKESISYNQLTHWGLVMHVWVSISWAIIIPLSRKLVGGYIGFCAFICSFYVDELSSN